MTATTLIIEAGRAERHYWRDLWRFRELFLVLAWRDVSVRYKQTIIGLAWALLQPLLTMLVFTFVFGTLAKLPSEGQAPYALMVYAGLLPWQLFSASLNGAAGSLVSNANLISKVYFPRLIVPTASVVVALIDFSVSLVLLVALMAWYQFVPTWHILLFPVFGAMAFLASLGPGLLIASLNVKYRDFRYIVPFIVQFGLYVSPVAFSSAIVPERWRTLYALNPMVGVIDGFRWAVLRGETSLDIASLVSSAIVVILFLWIGIRQFRKMEKTFADLI
jgi:lipopolysaccharide transport system permease protein